MSPLPCFKNRSFHIILLWHFQFAQYDKNALYSVKKNVLLLKCQSRITLYMADRMYDLLSIHRGGIDCKCILIKSYLAIIDIVYAPNKPNFSFF